MKVRTSCPEGESGEGKGSGVAEKHDTITEHGQLSKGMQGLGWGRWEGHEQSKQTWWECRGFRRAVGQMEDRYI